MFSEFPDLALPAWRSVQALHLGAEGVSEAACSDVAEEVPVAFRYSGFAHAVMMATPHDLVDFAVGFSLTERIVNSAIDLAHFKMRETDDGIQIDMALGAEALRRYLLSRRKRQLRGHTSCGICGAEELRDIQRPAARVGAGPPVDAVVLRRALDILRGYQPLSRRTRGAHAAAWVGIGGAIEAVREDVGRHNALDKLIGAGLRGAFSSREGFCLITSRCSYEMVQKAVAAGYGTLVAMSAPTAYAIRTAEMAGLTLFSLAREEGQILYTAPARREDRST